MGAWVRVPVFFSTQDALVAGGIITALVIAMRHHTTSEPLAMHATDALTVLASDPTHRQAVVMAGGAEAVTACMAAHADSAEMQAAGCALLQVISFDETVKPDLVEAGCVTAASEALSRHADVRWVAPQLRGVDPRLTRAVHLPPVASVQVPAVVMNAVSFLYFVADEVSTQVHSGGSRGDVLAEGVVTSLLRAMRKCEHEPDVQVSSPTLVTPRLGAASTAQVASPLQRGSDSRCGRVVPLCRRKGSRCFTPCASTRLAACWPRSWARQAWRWARCRR